MPLPLARALQGQGGQRGSTPPPESSPARERLVPIEEIERQAFAQALRHCDGNVAKAAKALGVAKGTVYNKMRRYGLLPRATGAGKCGAGDHAGA